MFFWGCIVLSTAFVTNFGGLVTYVPHKRSRDYIPSALLTPSLQRSSVPRSNGGMPILNDVFFELIRVKGRSFPRCDILSVHMVPESGTGEENCHFCKRILCGRCVVCPKSEHVLISVSLGAFGGLLAFAIEKMGGCVHCRLAPPATRAPQLI